MTILEALIKNYNYQTAPIEEQEVDVLVFHQWIGLMRGLFDYCKLLHEQKDWLNLSEMREHQENHQIYELLNGITLLIGDVAGYRVRMDGEGTFSLLAVAFYSQAITQARKQKNRDTYAFHLYRQKCEAHFGRLIAEQTLKPIRMLEEEQEEKKIIKRYKKKRKGNENKRYKIKFTTDVKICQSLVCELTHKITMRPITVDILSPQGTVFSEELFAGYCQECKKYLLLEKDYKMIKGKGIILCQLYTDTDDHSFGSKQGFFDSLKPESLLHRCGYNVNTAANLTSEQRQGILARVIDNELYSSDDLIDFLDWLIERNRNVMKKDMSYAIAKWQCDRAFVANYRCAENN